MTSAETAKLSQFSFNTPRLVLQKCGKEEAPIKAWSPFTQMVFIGVSIQSNQNQIKSIQSK